MWCDNFVSMQALKQFQELKRQHMLKQQLQQQQQQQQQLKQQQQQQSNIQSVQPKEVNTEQVIYKYILLYLHSDKGFLSVRASASLRWLYAAYLVEWEAGWGKITSVKYCGSF